MGSLNNGETNSVNIVKNAFTSFPRLLGTSLCCPSENRNGTYVIQRHYYSVTLKGRAALVLLAFSINTSLYKTNISSKKWKNTEANLHYITQYSCHSFTSWCLWRNNVTHFKVVSFMTYYFERNYCPWRHHTLLLGYAVEDCQKRNTHTHTHTHTHLPLLCHLDCY